MLARAGLEMAFIQGPFIQGLELWRCAGLAEFTPNSISLVSKLHKVNWVGPVPPNTVLDPRQWALRSKDVFSEPLLASSLLGYEFP